MTHSTFIIIFFFSVTDEATCKTFLNTKEEEYLNVNHHYSFLSIKVASFHSLCVHILHQILDKPKRVGEKSAFHGHRSL